MVAAPRSPTPSTSLSEYDSYDETTHIGTRFPNSQTTQLSNFLSASNSDDLIRDLAVLVSERGVVFFKNQDITIAQEKELALRMGSLTGRRDPGAGLHRHPVSETTSELGAEVSVIDSMGGIARGGLVSRTRASNGWHADITFENVPSDFTMLKMHTLPLVGGDTLWASAYEAYDRLSPAYKKFLEGLTAVHNADFFVEMARSTGRKIQDPRGHPENSGSHLTAVHPVIRTHPVTGWKGLFVNKSFTKHIVELTPDESDNLLEYLFRHVAENHDLQVRYRWETNDLAIWDNRCTWHTATNDYNEHRQGNRVVSIGEKPYFDPLSKSRRDVLNITVPM